MVKDCHTKTTNLDYDYSNYCLHSVGYFVEECAQTNTLCVFEEHT